jgi:TolB protein
MQRSVDANSDIWVLEIARNVRRRFTFDPAVEYSPQWSPDGSRIVYSSNRTGASDLYQKSSTDAGIEERLLATSENNAATDWSRDGRLVLYSRYRLAMLKSLGANKEMMGRRT